MLHESVLSRIKHSLAEYCGSKERIIVLIDNLDKSWVNGADLNLVSSFLFGLLDVGDNIIRDFSRDSNWNKKVNITLIIFLREDIFSLMKRYAPEADKLQISKIIWDDPELLLRVIEERMKGEENIDVWSTYFSRTVDGIDTKQFILDCILPKPRDLITLVNTALENAINRRHSVIDEKDIKDAMVKYSYFAFSTLITELQLEFPQLEDFLLNLVGDSAIIDRDRLLSSMESVGIEAEKQDSLLELLCQMSFLGFEIRHGDFRFCYSVDDYKKYKIISQKLSEGKNIPIRYKIHKAFWTELMIEGE